MGTLYIVATPIGNLQDITIRAIHILHDIDYIACEDTRRSSILLKSMDDYYHKLISKLCSKTGKPRLISYFEQNEKKRIPQIISLLKEGFDIALISDAGTPAISDPGYKLIRECINENIKVESIPGPSSVISSLVVSGLPTDKFLFIGYLPKKEGHRKKLLNSIKDLQSIIKTTVVMFETPHRLRKTLEEMKKVLGEIDLVIVREMTKAFEEVRRENINSSISHHQNILPRGEFVILFNLARFRDGPKKDCCHNPPIK